MAEVHLKVILADTPDLSHHEGHEFVRQVVRILASHRLIESGDVVETDCGYGLELPKRVLYPFETVAPGIWGGLN